MKVTFWWDDPRIASVRLRCLIPREELSKVGVGEGNDILVVSKHGFDWSLRDGFGKLVFDICDDHFATKHESHYRRGCEIADLITCNSGAMQAIIRRETGREATVIDDPYEDPELPPSDGGTLLWFGHCGNLFDLDRLLETLETDLPLEIISNYRGVTPWSPENVDTALRRCRFVLLPTGKNQAKSANRLIKALRYGKLPLAERLPAYEEIPGPWIGNINEGLTWAHGNPSKVVERIRQGQAAIRQRFSPATVGHRWFQVLSALT